MEEGFLCQSLLHIRKQCLRHDGICRARERQPDRPAARRRERPRDEIVRKGVHHELLRYRHAERGAKKDRRRALGHLSCGVGSHRAWLQRVLLRNFAAERFGRAAARSHGLCEQQRYDAVHRASLRASDRLGQVPGLCDRRGRKQRRGVPPQAAVRGHGALRRAGNDAHSLPTVHRHHGA